MDELRWALLLLGSIAILGILVHGLYSARKNAKSDKQSFEPKTLDLQRDTLDDEVDVLDEHVQVTVIDADIGPVLNDTHTDAQIVESDPDTFSLDAEQQAKDAALDALGVGPVRVVSQPTEQTANDDASQPEGDPAYSPQNDTTTAPVDHSAAAGENAVGNSAADKNSEAQPAADAASNTGKIYESVVSQPKPEYVATQHSRTKHNDWGGPGNVPAPPASLLKEPEDKPAVKAANQTAHQGKTAETDENIPHASQPHAEKPAKTRPSLAEQARNLVGAGKKPNRRREPRIAEDQMRIDFDEPAAAPMGTPGKPVEQEVLVINVKMRDGHSLSGAALLPSLLTLGFKYGDQHIFHRHVNSNGKGPVLFSLANMFKPGVFDIDNMENFQTQGVSLFMILPIEGDPHQVFNMMHNAARKLADEFSGEILDGRRSHLTKQSLQQYVEKIREFERKRRISG